jgi:hypothetical protein
MKMEIIVGVAAGNEQWDCADCHYVGALNRRGRCGRCDGDAVLPYALVLALESDGSREGWQEGKPRKAGREIKAGRA